MFAWFAVSALLVFAALYWLFFVKPAQQRASAKAAARVDTARRAVYAQSQPLQQDVHLTGPAYGALLRMAHGDRQKVEFWIIEVQRQMPGLSRSDAIDLLAERTAAPMAATA